MEKWSREAAFPLRGVLHRCDNVEVKLAEVTSADLTTRTVETSDGQTYQGDYLILAAGAQANFFHTQGAEQHAYPLYSLPEAETIQSRLLEALEAADRDPSLVERGGLNTVIVGGGPTGTELTGPIAFAAWLGVHAALLTTPYAKVGSVMDWAWDYFGDPHPPPRSHAAESDVNGVIPGGEHLARFRCQGGG